MHIRIHSIALESGCVLRSDGLHEVVVSVTEDEENSVDPDAFAVEVVPLVSNETAVEADSGDTQTQAQPLLVQRNVHLATLP